MEKIQEIRGKMVSTWNSEVKAVIDTWTTYAVSLDEFREAVLVKGINFAKAHGGVAWIVDSSKAEGVFSQEIQNFIGSDVFPTFVTIGVKYFITINSEVSTLTKLTVKSYASKAGPSGLQLVEVGSVKDALMWLKEKV